MQAIVDELELSTRAYWVLSSVRNGKLSMRVEFWEASETLQEIQKTTYWVRPLARAADRLMQDLIKGEPPPSAQIKTKILEFARKN